MFRFSVRVLGLLKFKKSMTRALRLDTLARDCSARATFWVLWRESSREMR